jgi:NADH-quinone oxidoreductase subunit J
LASAAVAALLGGVLLVSMLTSKYATPSEAHYSAPAPVLAIGQKLMTSHVLALEIIALMLTAALLGAVTLAMNERKRS